MSFLRELHRRNVFRVGAAYAVLAWIVLQVTDVVLNNVEAPGWIFHVVLLLLGIGFIFVMFFSWAFELTPEGLKREREVERSQSITGHTGRKLNRLIIALSLIAVAYFAYDKYVLSGARDAALVEATQQAMGEKVAAESGPNTVDKSIAVLPFVNLSSDEEQEYFSDGISEELLNVLAKVPGLHVTSRSSAFAFKGKEINIPEVANKLGVAHVLEGSVRKSGVKVRITAQLIEAESDKHLWSETYDRNLDDIFAIQDEISAAIVNALVAELGLDPEITTSPQPTEGTSTDAYTTFLLAQHQYNKRTPEGYIEAKRLFQEAIEQDPAYAPAYALLSVSWLLEGVGYGAAAVTVSEALDIAGPLIEKSLELDPNLAWGYAAKGLALRFSDKTADSIPVLQKALELNPSHSPARNWLSMAYRVQMRSREELELLREGHSRDPLTVAIATNLVKSLSRFERHDEAEQVLETLKSLNAGDHGFSRAEFLMLQGRYAEAIEAALRGEELNPGTRATMSTSAYIMAAMGNQREAHRLEPWEGGAQDFTAYLEAEIRDPVARHEAELKYVSDEQEHWVEDTLIWTYLGIRDFSKSKSMALARLDTLGPQEREIDPARVALAIIAWSNGDAETALAQIRAVDEITARNLADGDNISFNHLIQAVAQYFRGDDAAALAHLEEGFSNKAPMTFERYENVYSIYTSLGWDQRPEFQALLDGWEAHNAIELAKLFDLACNGEGFTVWTPLPESCATYAPAAGP